MTEGCPFEVFRSVDDDRVIGIIQSDSVHAGDLCTWGRGEEMAKSGLYWICPSCLRSTVPGKKLKGGGLATKSCPECGALLRPDSGSNGDPRGRPHLCLTRNRSVDRWRRHRA